MSRHALITGGAGGIGRAIVRALAPGMARIAVLDRADPAEAVAPGCALRRFDCDLADPAATLAVADEALAWADGRFDVFVHCAGVYPETPLDRHDLAAWRAVFAVNLDAALVLAQAVAPGMRSAGRGRMVFISSSTIANGRRDVAAYVASKLGLVGLARGLASDLGGDGITVNAVAPGFVETDATRAKFDRFDALAASIAKRQAVPRLATAEEIAGTVAFLCSDAAALITGQTWFVDGGWVRG